MHTISTATLVIAPCAYAATHTHRPAAPSASRAPRPPTHTRLHRRPWQLHPDGGVQGTTPATQPRRSLHRTHTDQPHALLGSLAGGFGGLISSSVPNLSAMPDASVMRSRAAAGAPVPVAPVSPSMWRWLWEAGAAEGGRVRRRGHVQMHWPPPLAVPEDAHDMVCVYVYISTACGLLLWFCASQQHVLCTRWCRCAYMAALLLAWQQIGNVPISYRSGRAVVHGLPNHDAADALPHPKSLWAHLRASGHHQGRHFRLVMNGNVAATLFATHIVHLFVSIDVSNPYVTISITCMYV